MPSPAALPKPAGVRSSQQPDLLLLRPSPLTSLGSIRSLSSQISREYELHGRVFVIACFVLIDASSGRLGGQTSSRSSDNQHTLDSMTPMTPHAGKLFMCMHMYVCCILPLASLRTIVHLTTAGRLVCGRPECVCVRRRVLERLVVLLKAKMLMHEMLSVSSTNSAVIKRHAA